MANVFFVGDTSNRHNWGCRATSFQMRRLLNDAGTITHALDTSYLSDPIGQRPQAKRRTQTSGRSRTQPKGKAALKKLIRGALFQYDRAYLQRYPTLIQQMTVADIPELARLIAQRKMFPNIADAIEACDALVINGEGSFLKDRGVSRFKMLIAYTAKVQFDRPVAIVNHTADVRNPSLRALAELVYPILDDALFREPYSLAEAAPLRAGKPADFAADCAFLYRPLDAATFATVASRGDYYSMYPEDAHGFDGTKPYICVGGSSAYLGRDAEFKTLAADYRTLCRRLSEIAPVVLTASSYPDDILLRAIARDLGLPFLGLATPVQQAVDVLGNALAYVGGRWHPAIMALTGGTPIVSFSANSDFKSRGITDLAGLDQPPISAFGIASEMDQILALAEDYVEQGVGLRSKLLSRVAELRDTCERNVRLLGTLA